MATNARVTSAPRKPLIWADDPLENDRYDDLSFRGARDASYVPGYSEKRTENEIRVRDGKPSLPIPRLQWVRGSNRAGEDVSIADEGMMEWRRLGYRACGLDDLESMGFGMPPTAHVGPDGTIRRQDLILFFVDEKRAQRNRIREASLREEHRGESESPSAPDGLEVYKDTRAGAAGQSLEDITKLDLPRLGE